VILPFPLRAPLCTDDDTVGQDTKRPEAFLSTRIGAWLDQGPFRKQEPD